MKGLFVAPAASICQPGAPILLTGSGLPADTTFNYRWRVVPEPLAVLAGDQTAEVGLIVLVVHIDPTYPSESCGLYGNL